MRYGCCQAVGSNGHLPEMVLFGSFPRRINKSGETRKRESDIRTRSASIGERGEGKEAKSSKRVVTRECRLALAKTLLDPNCLC